MGLRKLSLPLFRPRSSFVPIGQHRGIKPVRWRRRGAKIRVEGSKTWLYPRFLNLRVIFHDVTKPPTTLFFMCSIMSHFYGHGGGEKVSRPKSIPFFQKPVLRIRIMFLRIRMIQKSVLRIWIMLLRIRILPDSFFKMF